MGEKKLFNDCIMCKYKSWVGWKIRCLNKKSEHYCQARFFTRGCDRMEIDSTLLRVEK